MFPDSINLTTIALAIFVVCAGFVLLRGALRILLACLVLGTSAWVGFRLWEMAPELAHATLGSHAPAWLSTALPIAAFIVTFIVGRILVRFISSPFHPAEGERPPLTLSRLLVAAAFTLIPTALILTLLAVVIQHASSVAEIRHSASPSKSAPATPAGDVLHNLKSSIDQAIPSAWLKHIDPLIDPARVALAKIITEQAQPQHKVATDPRTGKLIPRAIVVDDPELQTLARDGNFATLLRSPLLTKALNDPEVQLVLKKLDIPTPPPPPHDAR